jgi:hypothetical protein
MILWGFADTIGRLSQQFAFYFYDIEQASWPMHFALFILRQRLFGVTTSLALQSFPPADRHFSNVVFTLDS